MRAPRVSTFVRLSMSAKNLPKNDLLSKSDPQAFLSIDNKEIGKTEPIQNNSNPEWVTKFDIQYMFEENQVVMIEVYDVDSKEKDHIGTTTFRLADLVVSKNQTLDLKIQKKNGGYAKVGETSSTVIVKCEEISNGLNALIQMTWIAKDLPSMGLLRGRPDGFLQFRLPREDGSADVMYKTEQIPNNHNPRWNPISITASALCNGDRKRDILIECFDHQNDGKHRFIGNAHVSLEDLKEGLEIPLKVEKGKSPLICLTSFKITEKFTFFDYIKAGMQVGVMVAIDFTGSNGDPRSSDSLHYIQPGKMNQYQQAIWSVGNILSPYDTDQKYPSYGFGAVLGDGPTNHCFPLSLTTTVELSGIQGIFDAYSSCVMRVLLSGPTNLADIIRKASEIASQPYSLLLQHYTILLIVCDGVINDMDRTKKAIEDASSLPLSIIIVGVGNADFREMEALDSDDKPLTPKTKRDILQFVPFRKFGGDPVRLAKETLAEVPGQILTYMNMYGIKPLKRL